MAIDFGRERLPDSEAQTDREQPPRRRLSIADLTAEAGFERRGRAQRQAQEEEQSVGEAARQGFTDGLSSELSAGSPMGALARMVESAEATGSKSVQDRMSRFPELREVELPKGTAARFPELAERPQRPERTSEDDLER